MTIRFPRPDEDLLVRPSAVQEALRLKAQVRRVALTPEHPAYGLFEAAWNRLSWAERWLVGDLAYLIGKYDWAEVPVYFPAGLIEAILVG